MSYTTQFSLGPDRTPTIIRLLMIVLGVMSTLATLINPLFYTFLSLPGPQEWFSLSWWGIKHYFLWQPISYLFVESLGGQGVTFLFLVNLAFDIYILWIIGSAVLEHVGAGKFLRFYLVCGIVPGLVSLALMGLSGHYQMIAGPSACLLALFTVWTMFHPESELLLFFLIPAKAKWLLAGILGSIVLISVSQLDFIGLGLYLSGILCGYLYGVIGWELQGPFAFTHSLEKMLEKISKRFRRAKVSHASTPYVEQNEGKIIDFLTGKPLLDDERFMDTMLTKISQHGEKSLSWSEKRRMKKISERKTKK